MGRECRRGGKEKCIYDFGGEIRRKGSLGKPRRWKDSIKINLREIRKCEICWMLNTAMNHRPLENVKFLSP
jgi:hypothetical protein